MAEQNPDGQKGLKGIGSAIAKGVENVAGITKQVIQGKVPVVKDQFNKTRASIERGAPVILQGIKNTGTVIGSNFEKAGMKAQQWWDGKQSTPLLNNFCSGNIVALKSRVTNKCVQLVTDTNMKKILNAFGEDGPEVTNTHWTVVNLGDNIVRLHVNNNYITISSAGTAIMPFPPGQEPSRETKLRVIILEDIFVVFESVHDPTMRLAFSPADGDIVKDALRTNQTAHFSCRVVYTPYQSEPCAK